MLGKDAGRSSPGTNEWFINTGDVSTVMMTLQMSAESFVGNEQKLKGY